jgi:hypothetical protein
MEPKTAAPTTTPARGTGDPYHDREVPAERRVRVMTGTLLTNRPGREPAATQDHVLAPWARRPARTGSLRLSRRHALAAGAAVVGVAALAAIVLALSGDRQAPVVIRVPGAPTGLAVAGDTVWVTAAGSQAAWPIEAASGRQAGPGVHTGGAPSRIAVGEHGLWIVDGRRGAVIPLGTRPARVYRPIRAGADVTDVELAAGAVWVASSAEGIVRAIEPGGRPVRRLPVGGGPVDLAAGGRWIVVAGAAAGTVTRIDAATREVVGAPIDVGGVPVAVAVSDETAWVADAERGAVVPVDLVDGHVGAAIPVGRRPVGVAAAGDDVWALSGGERTLVRIDGAERDVMSRQELGVEPTALAVGERHVWVAAGADRQVMRLER